MTQPLTLNLVEGSLSIAFPVEAAQALKAEIALLLERLKVTTTGGARKAPQPSMEYRYMGDVFLEVFCNPNIWPTPFAAKVLITARDERIRITTEAELTRLVEDLNQYLETVA
ncbi:hypothetical protein [Leptolyngbya sp. FACHB-261]|uniref:hypothetical protein n=1 Tax=Leptolyngbya sp. FACHB-261 TaxID=2692806 RepID=UPI0018EFABDE